MEWYIWLLIGGWMILTTIQLATIIDNQKTISGNQQLILDANQKESDNK